MAIAVASLDELDQDLVTQAQAELTQLLQERHPEAELTRGVIASLIGYFAGGIGGGVNQTQVNRVLQANSLLAISQNPLLADPALVDSVLSNWGIVRKQGAEAVGEITIVLSSNATAVVPGGAVFTANGQDFTVDSPYVARPPGALLTSDNERVLQPMGDGTYSFSVPATATLTGAAGNLRRSTKMVPASPPLAFVTAYAATDFLGGMATELNADMLTRLQEGVSLQGWGGRTNITALLKAQAEFANTLAYSIIGFGNPEMSRDQHWIFPASGGGRVDVYARTQQLPQAVTLTKTATLVQLPAAGAVWQFSITRDEAPGFYEVTQVIKPDDDPTIAGFAVTLDRRGYDLSDLTIVPDIATAEEAAYSRFQTAVIQFLDTETPVGPLTVGDTADFVVAVAAMPLIEELQVFATDHLQRYLAGDTLLKAAVPCFLTVNLDIQQSQGETAPDLDAIKSAMVTAVNTLGFTTQLNASLITSTVHGFLTANQAVGTVQMQGRIRRPDGAIVYIRDKSVLMMPDTPARMVTGQTTVFILDPRNIGISVVTDRFGASN